MMLFEQIATAGDRNFGYLLADTEQKQAVVIDPSGAPEKFVRALDAHGLKLLYILCTHHHWDHTVGYKELKQHFHAPFALHESSEVDADLKLTDGQILRFGKYSLKVIHTPGHTEDSVCYYLPGMLFTGDTLFVGKVGGTDFGDNAAKQYRSLHERILILPDDTRIYPGHDFGVKPVSTIKDEKQTNPFIFQPNLESFIKLKRNWLIYKAQHGIK
jgi:hydroxyacylglutathione hydrolase